MSSSHALRQLIMHANTISYNDFDYNFVTQFTVVRKAIRHSLGLFFKCSFRGKFLNYHSVDCFTVWTIEASK